MAMIIIILYIFVSIDNEADIYGTYHMPPGGRGRYHRRAPIIAHARPRVDPHS